MVQPVMSEIDVNDNGLKDESEEWEVETPEITEVTTNLPVTMETNTSPQTHTETEKPTLNFTEGGVTCICVCGHVYVFLVIILHSLPPSLK